MTATDEKVVDVLRVVVQRLGGGDASAAQEAISEIAFEPPEKIIRPNLAPALLAQMFRRDRFTCRYCAKRIVPPPVLRSISSLFPREFPYHNAWKTDQTHPAYWSITGSADHVIAVTSGGPGRDLENLVTACWACNSLKSNLSLEQLGWSLRPPAQTDWDGLTAHYPSLWEIAGRPDVSYHRPWLRALAGATQ